MTTNYLAIGGYTTRTAGQHGPTNSSRSPIKGEQASKKCPLCFGYGADECAVCMMCDGTGQVAVRPTRSHKDCERFTDEHGSYCHTHDCPIQPTQDWWSW